MNHPLQHNSRTTPDDISGHPFRTALVLGGGGSAGNAWLIGIIAGLYECGLDLTAADLIIGTSAGSTTAAQITGASPTELLAAILAVESQPPTAPSDRGHAPRRQATNQMETTGAIIAAAADAADMRRRIGRWALETSAASDSAVQTRWRATVAGRLPSLLWPQRRMLITAVAAPTGEPVAFDRHSGVDLVDAVAASCASGFAYRIGGSWYIDGGYRSNADNADLAAGYSRVLVLSPFGGRSRTPAHWGMHLASQVGELRAGGSRVETIFPEGEASEIFAAGGNVMNISTRPPAAHAGYRQGRALARQLSEFWC